MKVTIDMDYRIVEINGLRFSFEFFNTMFINPDPDVWLRVERVGDEITIHRKEEE